MSFIFDLKKIINTGQARAIILSGNVYDLFQGSNNKHVPLIDYLVEELKVAPTDSQKGFTRVVYEANSPIEVHGDIEELNRAWVKYHNDTKKLSDRFPETNNNSVYAFEVLRQMMECNRLGKTANNLITIVESADMLLPEAQISHMMPHDRKRVAIAQDWFGDPDFVNGHDTVILIAESRSLIHHRISRLPQVVSVEIPLPDRNKRWHFILNDPASGKYKKEHHCELADALSDQTAGLSLYAIRQILRSENYDTASITAKVEEYMVSQLGEGVVEFKRPKHKLEDVIGFTRIKAFMRDELMPGFLASGDAAIAGAAVGGPIGGGKTFICEAVASELEVPVIVLKNLRSKWFGETDQIFERLRRLLEKFYKIVIFVDEADTVFGGIDSDHDTERRLTGKIQGMMSDTALKGRIIWFLMTARIHRLSPDIRRPGRMDLIIPILDPEGEDHEAFARWTFGELVDQDHGARLIELTEGYSSAAFSMLRSRLKVKPCSTVEEAIEVAQDFVPPDIEETRRYQTLQAQLNCTRRSLLVDKDVRPEEFTEMRRQWRQAISELEAKGIR